MLGLLDFSQPFHIETDASGTGVGAVLLQNGHPLAFINKALGPRNLGRYAYEKEYLAILLAIEQWHHYLLQFEFFIHTDHGSLTHLNEQRLHTPWQQHVFTKLLGLQYKIAYRKGSDNGAADALSRRDHSCELLAVSSPVHSWLEVLVQWYSTDSEATTLLTQLSIDSSSRPPFQLRNGVILYNDRVWLGSNSALQV